MKIQTLIRLGYEYQLGFLELTLVPGIPQWQILGLPDQASREALVRVSAALRHHGYDVPASQKVLVQLHPGHHKKQCQGIDLAIALALLVESGQLSSESLSCLGIVNGGVRLPESPGSAVPLVYGSLTLAGEILRPSDVGILGGFEYAGPLLVGEGDYSTAPSVIKKGGYYSLRTLNDLRVLSEKWIPPQELEVNEVSRRREFAEGELEAHRFSPLAARAMMIAATGEHPTLVAGPSGLGKSIWAQGLTAVLPPLKGPAYESVQRWRCRWGEEILERPIISPHHSASSVAILGGGHPPIPGEISRAHGGVLLMDEFLEFSPQIQESLREPLETGQIRLARHGYAPTFPARFLLIGTTNLCSCGQYVPVGRHKCRCSLTRRRQYLERLSGPMLDRFSLLLLCHDWQNREHLRRTRVKAWLKSWSKKEDSKMDLMEIMHWVDQARNFAENTRGQIFANHRLREPQLLKEIEPLVIEKLIPQDGMSLRRRRALLSVARTIADLDGCETMTLEHFEEAAQWTTYPFYALQGFS